MPRIRYILILAVIAFTIACTRSAPKESVASVHTTLAENLQRAFFLLSANDDLSESKRKKFLETAVSKSVGSGFVVAEHEHDGHLLLVTNKHVIEGGDHPHLSFDDGETLHVAQIVYTDPEHDLAVLTFKLGDKTSHGFNIAETYSNSEEVTALGYPVTKDKGSFQTTKGNISNPCLKERDLVAEKDKERAGDACWIKHTAPFDPGSSGGPLLTASHSVAGVNTMILQDKHSVFLAIPAETVNRAIERAEVVLEKGRDRTWLRDNLRDTCKKFIDEIGSAERNYDVLHNTLSNALVAQYGHDALEFVLDSSYLGGRIIVNSVFEDDPIRALRGSLLKSIVEIFQRHEGVADNESCQRINSNDDIAKPDGTVRIAVRLRDKSSIELKWILENSTWRLRDFNIM